MDVAANPPLDEIVERALLAALEQAAVLAPADAVHGSPWRTAGLVEALDRDGRDDAYAPSPRSTRGATRA